MIWITSKLGLLLVVLIFANGEREKDSTEKKPPSDKAKLRDWFFRLSLRNDLINLKKDGQDYLAVVKLRTEDGDGEDLSILFDEDHPHPSNNCSSQPSTEGKEMRFVMRGLGKEFMCSEIIKKIPDVPDARSMDSSDTSQRGESKDALLNFIEETKKAIEETTKTSDAGDENPTVVDHLIDEDSSLPQKITNFKNMVDAVSISEADSEDTPASEKYLDWSSPILYPAEVMAVKNETKIAGGLNPIIDHLNGVSSHKLFNNSVYAKAIEDLVKDLESHDQSEATWDSEKLNLVLNKIEELVTGGVPDERAGTDDENADRTGAVDGGSNPSPSNDTLAESTLASDTTAESTLAATTVESALARDTTTSSSKEPSENEETLAKGTTTDELSNEATTEKEETLVNGTTTLSSDDTTATEEVVTLAKGPTTLSSDDAPATEEVVTLPKGPTTLSSDDSSITEETSAPSSDETSKAEESVDGTSTPPSDDTSEASIGDSAAQSEDDTPKSTDLNEMLSSWKEKFHIILGFFIVFLVLFLIIIAVLIYKIQKNKNDSVLLQEEK